MTDHQFSVRAVVDGSSRAVHERVEYDAYGRPKVRLGADVAPVDAPDGQINVFDYGGLFISWFNAGDPRADLNGDGQVNLFDLTIYSSLYSGQQYGGELSDVSPLGPMNVIGFAGYHWDEELGLWLSRHRVYDPELGRWIQRDPAGYVDGMSLYAYVMGNPFSLVDPTGLFWQKVKDAAAIAGSGVKELYAGSFRRSMMLVQAAAEVVSNPVETVIGAAVETKSIINDVAEVGMASAVRLAGEATGNQGWIEAGKDFNVESATGQLIANLPSAINDAYNGNGNLDVEVLTLAGAVAGAKVPVGKPTRGGTAIYRYTGPEEAAAARKTGNLHARDRFGHPSDKYYTNERFNTISEAESRLRIGKQDPRGEGPSPTHRVEVYEDSVRYNYEGTAGTNGAKEMTTRHTGAVKKVKELADDI